MGFKAFKLDPFGTAQGFHRASRAGPCLRHRRARCAKSFGPRLPHPDRRPCPLHRGRGAARGAPACAARHLLVGGADLARPPGGGARHGRSSRRSRSRPARCTTPSASSSPWPSAAASTSSSPSRCRSAASPTRWPSANLALAHGSYIAPHQSGGPVATAVCLQLAACVPNFLIQEHFDAFNEPWTRELVTWRPTIDAANGHLSLPDAPGLGIDLVPEVIADHPYDPQAFLNIFEEGWEKRVGGAGCARGRGVIFRPRTAASRRIDTYVVGARWCNWVFAHVYTDEGICGVGEGTCEFQPKAVEAVIEQLARRVVVGQSAFQIEKLWQEMFRNEFARGGPILNAGIAAIEIALWDIVGKCLDRPVYDLLGGRLYERLPAYANAWYGAGANRDEIAAAAQGSGRERLSRPQVRSLRPCRTRPDGDVHRRGDRPARRRARRGRAACRPPDRRPWPLQPRHRRSRSRANLERHDVFWFEEPTDPENVHALHKIGRSIERPARDRRALLHALPPPGAARHERDRRAPARHHACRRHPGGQEDRRDRRRASTSRSPSTTRSGRWRRRRRSSSTPARPISSCRNRSASTRRLALRPRRASPAAGGGHYAIPTAPGLGVGEFRPEAARAHPFDPDAFLPMWQENWRANF